MLTFAAPAAAPARATSSRMRWWAALAAAPVVLWLAATVVFALANAEDYATDAPRLLRYVVGPAALALLLVALVSFTPERLAALVGGLAISVLLALFAFEALLTATMMGAWLGQVGHGVSDGPGTSAYRGAMPPAATLKALNNSLGVERPADAVLAHEPFADVLLCVNADGPITYRADRYGFRNDDTVHDAPVDTVVLGDSFIEGVCLPDGADVVARLGDLRPGTAGVGTRGTGPLFQLATLGRFGPELAPDTVVVAFFAGNDWENLERSLAVDWLVPVLEPGARFGEPSARSGDAEVSAAVERMWRRTDMGLGELLRRRSVLRNFAALQQTALQLGLHYPKAPPELPAFETALARTQAVASEWGGRVVLAFIPPVDRYVGLLDSRLAHDGLRATVAGTARRLGIPVIDIAEHFDAAERPAELYAGDGHFTERGAALAARIMADGLERIEAKEPALRVAATGGT